MFSSIVLVIFNKVSKDLWKTSIPTSFNSKAIFSFISVKGAAALKIDSLLSIKLRKLYIGYKKFW